MPIRMRSTTAPPAAPMIKNIMLSAAAARRHSTSPERAQSARSGDAGGGEGATVISDGFGGRPLNGPNDVAVDGQGAAFFTDPVYAFLDKYNARRALLPSP